VIAASGGPSCKNWHHSCCLFAGNEEEYPMRQRSLGFTVIELVVTIAVIAILVGVSMYAYQDALPGIQVKAAARQLMGNLQRARLTAISTNNTATITFDTTGNSYTMSSGAGTEVFPMSTEFPRVQFGAVTGTTAFNTTRGLDDGVTLAGNAFTIDRRGRPSADGEIYLIAKRDLLKNLRDRTYCVTVSQIGAFRLLRYSTTVGWQ
jgi:prepilin-type N-terminal cleavage/methylation domain-containing protein